MRLLMMGPNPPYPPTTGGNQRTHLIFRALQQVAEVDFVLVGDTKVSDEELAVLQAEYSYLGRIPRSTDEGRLQRWVFGLPGLGKAWRKLHKMLSGWRSSLLPSSRMSLQLAGFLAGGRYDAIVARYLATACQTDAFGPARVFVDLDDLDSEVWSSRALEEKRWHLAWSFRRLAASYRRKERGVIERCAGAWVAKQQDLEALQLGHVRLLRNIPFASYPSGVRPLPPSTSGVVLGVGVFDWRPNQHGFNWFVTQVWPLVHRQRPGSVLYLVGKLTDNVLRQQWSSVPGIQVLGRVQDLEAVYRSTLFSVAPIFSGGGTNIKVIESLAYGRCCVLTPHAAKGFERIAGLRVGTDAESFAQQCVALLDSPEQAARWGRQASESVNQEFGYPNFAAAVREVVGAPVAVSSV